MKKPLITLCIVLASLMLCLSATAETQIFCAGQEDDFLPRLCTLLAKQLGNASATCDGDTLTIVNQFLAADDSAVYIGNPHAMILSLQGYTDADLRTEIAPVVRLASAPATLYATEGALTLCAETSEEDLMVFTENQPFELFIARLVDASPEDYLTLESTALLYVDQNLYMDYEEAAQAAIDGAADLYVFGAEVPDELQALLTPLYQTVLDGPFLGAFVHTGADSAQLEAALLAALSQPATQEMLTDKGYASASWQNSADFAETVKTLFADYIQYLTNEGLFFYEF